jgi:predicted O-methyltransferase YrrM
MNFNGIALNKQEIEKLCQNPKVKERYTSHSEMFYSHGKLVKEKYFYPSFLDLYVTLTHGVMPFDNISIDDILQETQYFFAGRKINNSKYKNILVTGHMFLYYKEKNNIRKKKDAVGTVVFPLHSLDNVDWDLNWKIYIDKLKSLPKEFHPLLICLHYADVQKGLHNIFYENGFYVTSAGHAKDPKFVERFYNILSSCKYSTSNSIMSSTFYAVDFGLPFFLYGEDDNINGFNKNNIYHVKGNFKRKKNDYKGVRELFSEITTEINSSQKDIVNKYLGFKNQENNKYYISYVLYKEFFKYQLKFLKDKFLIKSLKKYNKYIDSNSLNIINHMRIEEKALLVKYSKKVKNGNIVEIGSFLGSNTINLSKNSPSSTIYAIDNWDRHQKNSFETFQTNIRECKNIKVLNNDFETIYKNLDIKIDLLIIDGEHHSYEVINRDLKYLFPILKKGGVIIIHHYEWTPYVKMNIIDYLKKDVKKLSSLKNLWVGKKIV